MSYTIYILRSISCNRFYTGQTHDFDNRIIEHNAGETASLKACIPWILIWKTEVLTRSEAMILERKIKARGASRYLTDIGIIVQ